MRPVFSVLLGVLYLAVCPTACSKTSEKESPDAGMDAVTDASGRVCEYGGRSYSSGSEFCDIRGCNGCICDQIQEGGVACTLIGCSAYADGGVGLCRRTSWHQPDQAEPTTLQLYEDGSFRWLTLGCDSFSRDVGIWREDGGTITLSPAPGRSDFTWPGGAAYSELQAEIKVDGLYAMLEQPQNWQRGGRCPVCNEADAGADAGMDGGAQTIEACGNPFAYCNEYTEECAAR